MNGRHGAEISLVLTVLNEVRSMPRFLASVESQTHLPDEIVIVDGGSSDGTSELLRAWTPPSGVRLSVLVHPGVGIAEGRNLAIEAARGPNIAVSDGGTTLDPNWLAELHRCLESGVDVASGFFVPAPGGFMQTAIATVITPHLGEIDPARFLPSSRSVAFRKQAWESVGGYPTWLDYCEDLVFDLNLKREGCAFDFVPTAVVTWDARPRLRDFAKQYYRYSRGDGKADLWVKRHVARYSAHALGIGLVSAGLRGSRWAWPALATGYSLYMQKFVRRVLVARNDLGRSTVPILALSPVVVAVGDVAKMAGYPAGVMSRRSARTRR